MSGRVLKEPSEPMTFLISIDRLRSCCLWSQAIFIKMPKKMHIQVMVRQHWQYLMKASITRINSAHHAKGRTLQQSPVSMKKSMMTSRFQNKKNMTTPEPTSLTFIVWIFHLHNNSSMTEFNKITRRNFSTIVKMTTRMFRLLHSRSRPHHPPPLRSPAPIWIAARMTKTDDWCQTRCVD